MFQVTINAAVCTSNVQFFFAEWGTRGGKFHRWSIVSPSCNRFDFNSIRVSFESLGILVCMYTDKGRERDSNAKVRFALTASRRRRNNELRRLRVAPRLYSRPWITEFGGITRGGVKTPRARERYTDAQTDASRDCPGVG